MKLLLRLAVALALVVSLASTSSAFTRGGYTTNIASGNCPQGTSFADGCSGAAATGFQNAALLVPQTVVRLDVTLGTSPTNGTYTLTASGCTGSGFQGSVTVSGGPSGGIPTAAGTIVNPGIGYTCKPTITPPGGLGSGAVAIATVYQTRPAWNVAGVDYPVGLPTSVVLSNPISGGSTVTALTNLGCGYNSSNFVISCSGASCNNAVYSGWDFSLGGSQTLDISSCTNPTITQNKFAVGTSLREPLQIEGTVAGVTITFNTFEGNGIPTIPSNQAQGGMLILNPSSTGTVKYNVIQNAYFQTIEAGATTAGANSFDIEDNFISNAGTGHPIALFTASVGPSSTTLHVTAMTSGTLFAPLAVCAPTNCDTGPSIGYIISQLTGTGGATCPDVTCTGGVGTYQLNVSQTQTSQAMGAGGSHGDQIQVITQNNSTVGLQTYGFNYWQQTGTNSTQGLSICSAGGQIGDVNAACSGAVVNNNVMIFGPNTSVTYNIIIDNTWQNGASSVTSNYIDQSGILTGIGGSWFFFGQFNGVPPAVDGPFNGALSACTGNKNLVDGTTFTTTAGNVGSVCSFLLKRDIDPASNDNDPMWLEKAA